MLTLKLLNILKSRLRFNERWKISRVNNPKTEKCVGLNSPQSHEKKCLSIKT